MTSFFLPVKLAAFFFAVLFFVTNFESLIEERVFVLTEVGAGGLLLTEALVACLVYLWLWNITEVSTSLLGDAFM
jgi:hypothetical protein